MQTASPMTVVFGSDRRTSVRFAGVAIVLSAFLFGVGALFGSEDPLLWLATGYNAAFFAALLLVLAGWCAYRRGGLLVSVLCAFVPIFVVLFQEVGVVFASGPITPVRLALTAASGSVFYGVPIGVLGFLLGVGVRRATY